MKFKELYEARQRGTLYHYTSYDRLISILESNILKKSKGYGNVSFTRNKNFLRTSAFRSIYGEDVKLVLDGDKLSNKYKIKPFNYYRNQEKNLLNQSHPIDTENREQEEIIEKDISNIKSYIKEIIIGERKFGRHIQFFQGDNTGKYNTFEEFIDFIKKTYKGKIKIVMVMK